MRKAILFTAIVATLVVAAPALATGDYVFRYKYDGVFAPPASGSPADDGIVCAEPSGRFSASMVSKTSSGCLYLDPEVEVAVSIPPKLAPADLDQWCQEVTEYSAVSATEAVGRRDAAIWGESSWAVEADAPAVTDVLCSPSGSPAMPETPPLRAGTLQNADFEATNCGYSPCGWLTLSGTFSYYDDERAERWVGGKTYITPKGNGSGQYYSDVPVGPEETASGFPVSVRWLQSARFDDVARSAGVELRFLDAEKSRIGAALASDLIAPPYKYVWLDRVIDGVAPPGTAYVRVVLNHADPRTIIDNVALVINGVAVSEINGGYGFPSRPRDLVMNAGAESGTDHWIAADDPSWTRDVLEYVNPENVSSGAVFGNNHYPDNSYYQQVWIEPVDRGKPFTLDWMQGASVEGVASVRSLMSVEFFDREGTGLGIFDKGSVNVVQGFMNVERMSGTVPADADFALVRWTFQDVQAGLDNITFAIGGRPYSAFAGRTPVAHDICPAYVDTVAAPHAEDYWFNSSSGVSSFGDDGAIERTTYLGQDPDIYKFHCVGPNDRYLVARYDMASYRGFAGLIYRAYDENNQVIGEKRSLRVGADPTKSGESEQTFRPVWEVYRLPEGTTHLMTQWWTENATRHYVGWAKDMHLTMNGGIPVPPAGPDKLRNTQADQGTSFWSPVRGSQARPEVAAVSLYPLPPGVAASGTSTVAGSVKTTTFTCETEAFCATPSAPDNLFRVAVEGGDIVQDVYVSGYGFNAGAAVRLGWRQGSKVLNLSPSVETGGDNSSHATYELDTYFGEEAEATMGVQFYDIDDNLLGSSFAPMHNAEFGGFMPVFRDLDSVLPAGTYRVRVVMRTNAPDHAEFDRIELEVGGIDLAAE